MLILPSEHPAAAAVGINQQINFQGRLLTASGAVVPDGVYNMRFKIYQDGTGCVSTGSSPCGGTLKWTETWQNSNSQGIVVKNGYFSLALGSITAFASNVDWNQDTLWLSTDIAGTGAGASPTYDGEMLPFKRLSAAPYALQALNSGKLGGLASGQYVQLAQGIQADSSTTQPSIGINKTAGTQNLITLQSSGTDVFDVTSTGNLQFGNNADKTINVATAASGNSGNKLIVQGGSGNGTDKNGGDLVLQGGNSTGAGTPGAVIVKPQTNSLVAFQVQPSGSTTPVLDVDTTNGRVGIGNAAPGNTLDVGPAALGVGTSVSLRVGDIVLTSNQGGDNSIAAFSARGSSGNLILDAVAGQNLYTSPYTTNNNFLAAGGGKLRVGSFTVPNYSLDVTGDINASGNVRTGNTIRIDNAGALTNVTADASILTSGTLGVARGGTGVASTTAYGLLFGGITSTSAFQSIGTGSAGQVLQSNGAGALPSWVGGAGCSTCIAQVPGTTAQNTITPTVASVVALTVNATSSTSAVALAVVQSQTADAATISVTNTSGTNTNALLINRNGASGTTTNGINITNTAGTLTNGLAFTGTIGTDITRGSGTLTLQGAGGVSITAGATNAVTIDSAGAGSVLLGNTNAATITVGATASAGTITVGRSTASNTINIGTGTTAAGNTQTINVGTSATSTGAAAITIGNTNSTSTLNLQAGTGDVNVKANSSAVNSAVLSVQQAGTGDAVMELQNGTAGSSFYFSNDASNTNTLSINSSSAATGVVTATPAHVQTATSSSSAGGATTLAFGSNNTAGSLIVVATTWDASTATGITCADSKGNVYATPLKLLDTNAQQYIGVCYAPNIAAGANSVTVTYTGGTPPVGFRELSIHEYSGVATTNPLDTSASTFGSGSTGADGYTTTASTTTTNGDLIFGMMMDDAGTSATLSAGTGFNTLRANIASPGPFAAEDKVQATAGSVAATFTSTAAHTYAAYMLAFKPGLTTAGALTDTTTNSLFTLTQSGLATFRNSINSTSGFLVQNAASTNLFQVDTSNNRIYIGNSVSDTTGALLVVDTSSSGTEPTGVNGAIYYNTGGSDGASGASAFSGKFRCYEGGLWKSCIGMRDITERRWGYAAQQGTATAGLGADGLFTSTILGAGSSGTPAVSSQAESNYIIYPTTASTGAKGGIGNAISATATQSRWLPKLVTRIRVDAAAVTSSRYWVALAGGSLDATNPATASAAFATSYIGVGMSSSVNSSKWLCGSGDGTNHTGTDMGITVTANHYYDIIVDLSTAGTLVCSVADNGGAFTTVTKTTNLPAASTSLGPEETITALTTAVRNISIAYLYLEYQ